jgi:hypothetical protein
MTPARRLPLPRASRSAALLAALLLLGPGALPAAEAPGRGRIRGTVRDLQGKPVPGLLVRLTSPVLGLVHVTDTNEKGVYAFAELATGSYDVEVSGSGYQRQIKTGIVVQPPFRNIVDFALPPGPLAGAEEASPVVYRPPEGEPQFQEATARFVDKNRRPIPDVLMILFSPATGASFRARSDREGRIRIERVPVGLYRALATSPGYVTVDLKQVEVGAASGLSLSLSLVEYPLRFEGRAEDLMPEEKPVPPGYGPPGS